MVIGVRGGFVLRMLGGDDQRGRTRAAQLSPPASEGPISSGITGARVPASLLGRERRERDAVRQAQSSSSLIL